MMKFYTLFITITLLSFGLFASSGQILTKDQKASGIKECVPAVEETFNPEGSRLPTPVFTQACDSLTTAFNSNNGLNGNMFDVIINNSISIFAFDVNCTSDGWFNLYYKSGTYVGFETDATAWTFHDSVFVTSNGQDVPTSMALDSSLSLASGNIYALYIFYSGSSFRYTDGTLVGTVAAGNNDLQILEGEGNTPYFGNSHFGPRIFNGTVHYCDSLTAGENELTVTDQTVNVYPVPANEFLRVHIGANFGAISSTVRLTDVTGKVVSETNSQGSAVVECDLRSLTSGLYFYQVVSSTGIIASGKFSMQ